MPLFADHCRKQYENNINPNEIVISFLKNMPRIRYNSKTRLDFSFIQYIERQVVLFDAIEDAGFSYVNNMHGRGTLRNMKEEAENKQLKKALTEYVNRFKVRIVLQLIQHSFIQIMYLLLLMSYLRRLQKII